MRDWNRLAAAALSCALLPAVAAPFAYVANRGAGVSVIDLATDTVVATLAIPGGCGPQHVAFDTTGTQAFVSCINSPDAYPIDTGTNAVGAALPVCGASWVSSLSLSASRMYASCFGNLTVAVRDRSTNALITSVPVSGQPGAATMNPSRSRLYVPRFGTNAVAVVDLSTNAVVASVPVGDTPYAVAVIAAGKAYVANANSNNVSVIDTTTNAVVASIPVGAQPLRAVATPDGSRVVIANLNSATLSIIDTATDTVVSTVATGIDPAGLDLTPAGDVAYVSGLAINMVRSVHLTTGALSPLIPVGPQPVWIAIAPVRPTVTIDQAAAQTDPAGVAPVNFTVTFSEPVSGFTGASVSFASSTAPGTLAATVTGGPTTYNVAVAGMTGSGTVVASIPAAAATNLAGIASLASTSTDNTVAFVDPPPTVTINQAPAQGDPVMTGPIVFRVVFSEPVAGFTNTDVSFAGSTVGGTLLASVTGSGTTYDVSVSGMTGNGVVVASIPAGAATGSPFGANLASTSTDNTVTFGSSPSVAIDQAAGQGDPASGSPIVFAVVFNQVVTGFTNTDVSFAGSTVGGTLAANVTGSGANYTVSVSGMTGNGTVVASIPAGAATNGAFTSLVSTSTDNSVTFDTTAPTVTINQASGQADPAGTSPVTFTVVFSEAITGFTAADVSFAGSTAAGTLAATITGTGPSYTVSVSGMTGNGLVVASIGAAAANDLAGNASAASTSSDHSVAYTGAGAVVTTYTALSGTGSGMITASFTGGGPTCSFSGPQFIGAPPGAAPVPATSPPGSIGFPHGLFAFTTVNCTAGSTLAFTITYPSALPAGTQYWKFGPEPGNATPHWYVLPATIVGNVATFTITDGAQGDDDLAANGTIVDQGGPGFPVGAGAQQTPTMSQLAMALMALLMALYSAGGLRRRRA